MVRAGGDLIDPTEPEEAMRFLASLAQGAGRPELVSNPAAVGQLKAEGARADCEVGAALTARLRLPQGVGQAVLDAFERFDGHGRSRDGRAMVGTRTRPGDRRDLRRRARGAD